MNDVDIRRLHKKIKECEAHDKLHPFKSGFDAVHDGIGRALTNEEIELIIKNMIFKVYSVIDDFELAALFSCIIKVQEDKKEEK